MKKIIIITLIILGIVSTSLIIWGMKITINETMPKPEFALYDPGTEKVVQYEKYGEFTNEGKSNYKCASEISR